MVINEFDGCSVSRTKKLFHRLRGYSTVSVEIVAAARLPGFYSRVVGSVNVSQVPGRCNTPVVYFFFVNKDIRLLLREIR